MFAVKIYLKNTTDKGIGVFAKEKIKKGQLIWEFVEGLDIKIHEDTLKKIKLKDCQLDFIKTYFWKEGEYYYSSCDHSVFQNHSTKPNSIPDGENMVANRDIEPDEEITVDYSFFDDDYSLYKDDLLD